jgi:4-hydroxy-3-polyprenylbenzoate decarboxylase
MHLVVGITGASGARYGVRLLQELKKRRVETYLIVTKAAEYVLENEMGITVDQLKSLATAYYDIWDITAPISSGSTQTNGMVIAPCSMKTLACISHGVSTNLLLRAADVTLKEGRKLIVVPRETPLNVIHLRNMLNLAEQGVVIIPAMPAYYHKPKDIDSLVDYVVGKIFDSIGIGHELYIRWSDL